MRPIVTVEAEDSSLVVVEDIVAEHQDNLGQDNHLVVALNLRSRYPSSDHQTSSRGS